jgi:hypothetical protein
MAVLSLLLCEAQQSFSWSFPQHSLQLAALPVPAFMHDFASLPLQQAEDPSPEPRDIAFSSFPASPWWQQDFSSLPLAILAQHAHSAFACGAAFSCAAGAAGFGVVVWAHDATVRARIDASNLNFMVISFVK